MGKQAKRPYVGVPLDVALDHDLRKRAADSQLKVAPLVCVFIRYGLTCMARSEKLRHAFVVAASSRSELARAEQGRLVAEIPVDG